MVEPPSDVTELSVYIGKNKGIQGHHNSCYLDAMLFSMFSFSLAFDQLLHRPRRQGDIEEYEQVQGVLRDCIVNPLRKWVSILLCLPSRKPGMVIVMY